MHPEKVKNMNAEFVNLLKYTQNSSNLDSYIDSLESKTKYLTIDHSLYGPAGESFTRVAHRDIQAKLFLSKLANKGFYQYRNIDCGSKFVRDHEIKNLWHSIREGTFSITADGTVYSYSAPQIPSDNPSLIVVFSSMSSDLFGPGLARFFEQNFKGIQKFISPSAAVLRIADIGGVVGGFYMNTIRRPENEASVQRLIAQIAHSNKVNTSRIVLYGASKGGTASLYHGLIGNYQCVSVDPIVDDSYYESRYSDSHFTSTGIFLSRKKAAFLRAAQYRLDQTTSSENGASISLITSQRSPQFTAIEALTEKLTGDNVRLYTSLHPEISDHPDVSPNMLSLAISLINMGLYGIPSDQRRLDVL